METGNAIMFLTRLAGLIYGRPRSFVTAVLHIDHNVVHKTCLEGFDEFKTNRRIAAEGDTLA